MAEADLLSCIVRTKQKKTDFKGKRVGLYFAAGWCPMCTSFEPSLLEFRAAAASGESGASPVALVLVSSDGNAEAARTRSKAESLAGARRAAAFRRMQERELHFANLKMLQDGVVAALGRNLPGGLTSCKLDFSCCSGLTTVDELGPRHRLGAPWPAEASEESTSARPDAPTTRNEAPVTGTTGRLHLHGLARMI